MVKGISETAFASQVEDLLKIKGYPKISERDFLKQVIDLAHIFGWKVAHFRPAKTEHGWRTAVQGDGAGFPDLVLVHPEKRRLIFAELKSENGITTPEQEAWLEDLRECVKQISLEPIERKGKPTADGWAGIERLVPSLEVYLWLPSQIEEIAEVLK